MTSKSLDRKRILTAAALVLFQQLEPRQMLSASLIAEPAGDDSGETLDAIVVDQKVDSGDDTSADPGADAGGDDTFHVIYYMTPGGAADDGSGEVVDDGGSSDVVKDVPADDQPSIDDRATGDEDLIKITMVGGDDGSTDDTGGEVNPTDVPVDENGNPIDPQVIYYSTGGLSTPAPIPTIAGGIVTVTGTDAKDRILINADANDATKIVVKINGVETSFTKADVTRIDIDALGGNDCVIVNTDIATRINGGDGNDKIRGGAGDDLIDGGAGNDKINGRAGNDTVKGGGGNDKIYGQGGDDDLRGQAGDDDLFGGKGNDAILGGAGRDKIRGGQDNDVLKGGAGKDKIRGDAGADLVDDSADKDDSDHGDLLVGQMRLMRPIWWSDEPIDGGDGTDITPSGKLRPIWAEDQSEVDYGDALSDTPGGPIGDLMPIDWQPGDGCADAGGTDTSGTDTGTDDTSADTGATGPSGMMRVMPGFEDVSDTPTEDGGVINY